MNTIIKAQQLGYRVIKAEPKPMWRRCQDCEHYPGQADRLCQATNRTATSNPKQCRRFQAAYVVPDWLK